MVDGNYLGKQSGIKFTRDIQELTCLLPRGVLTFFLLSLFCLYFWCAKKSSEASVPFFFTYWHFFHPSRTVVLETNIDY